jgi:hypothetical protein
MLARIDDEWGDGCGRIGSQSSTARAMSGQKPAYWKAKRMLRLKRLRFIVLFSAAAALLRPTFAEEQYTIRWSHSIGNAWRILPDSRGFIVPLISTSNFTYPEESLVGFVRLDADGNTVTRNGFAPAGMPVFVAPTSDGGAFALVSEPFLSSGIQMARAVAMKYSSSLVEERRHTFDAEPRTAVADRNGGFWLPLDTFYSSTGSGYSRSIAWVDEEISVVHEYPFSDGVTGDGLIAAPAGGFYMKERLATGDVLSELYISKISPQGELLWRKLAGYENGSNGWSLGEDGFFVGVGDTRLTNGWAYELFRRDGDWNLIWRKDFSSFFVSPWFTFATVSPAFTADKEMKIDPLTGDVTLLAPYPLPEDAQTTDGSRIDARGLLFQHNNVPDGTPQILISEFQRGMGTLWLPLRGAIKNAGAGATVRMVSTASGAEIFYTDDGSIPNRSSQRYGGDFVCRTNATELRALAIVGSNELFSEPVELINGIEIVADPQTTSLECDRETAVSLGSGSSSFHRSGAVTRVTAFPREGWIFSRWAGSISSTNQSFQITPTNRTTLRPVFSTGYKIEAPGGHGRVFHYPDGELFDEGSSVRWIYVPDPGYQLQAGNGDNPSTVQVVTPNYYRMVSFETVPEGTLGLTVLANGHGQVEVTPAKSAHFPGDVVQIRAFPKPGANFYGFAGTISDTNGAVTITLQRHHVILANFSEPVPPLLGVNSYVAPPVVSGNEIAVRVLNNLGTAVRLQRSPDCVRWSDVPGDIAENDFTQIESYSEAIPRQFYRTVSAP